MAIAGLKAAADQAGVVLNAPPMAYNTRLAHEGGKYAETRGAGDRFHDVVFRAYFVDGLDIGDPHVLSGLAASIGLSGDEMKACITVRKFSEAVDRDWKRSREMFITAVPTFMMGDQKLVGAQSYEILKGFVEGNL